MSKTIIILSLTDMVSKKFGYPREWYKPEVSIKFVTVKEFIDNPETIQSWRVLNSYYDSIEFSKDVYEYLDEKNYTAEQRAERKKARDLQKV